MTCMEVTLALRPPGLVALARDDMYGSYSDLEIPRRYAPRDVYGKESQEQTSPQSKSSIFLPFGLPNIVISH